MRNLNHQLNQLCRYSCERLHLLTRHCYARVHHQHLWSLDGENHVLTAHIVVDGDDDAVRHSDTKVTVAKSLEEYGLAHTTIEAELHEDTCRDEPVTHYRPAG